MARRSKNKSLPTGPRQARYLHPIANLRLHALPVRRLSVPDPRLLIEDRRSFHPNRAIRPAGSIVRADARLMVGREPTPRAPSRLPHTVQFDVPKRVSLCVRRKRRKEVIHAKGISGSRTKRPKRNQFSDVRC